MHIFYCVKWLHNKCHNHLLPLLYRTTEIIKSQDSHREKTLVKKPLNIKTHWTGISNLYRTF